MAARITLSTLFLASLVAIHLASAPGTDPGSPPPAIAQAAPRVLEAKPAKAPEPPRVQLPAEHTGEPADFIRVDAVTNGTQVRWLAVTPGLAVFPGDLLRDSRSTVVIARAAGSYRLAAYTALGDTPSEPAFTTIIVGKPKPTPPWPGPDPEPEPEPEPEPQPIPPDTFDNVGQVAAREAAKLPADARAHAKATAALYSAAADKLEDGTLVDVPAAAAWLQSERTNLWKDTTPAWSAFNTEIGKVWTFHQQKLGGFTKTDAINFYRALAAGLATVR